MSYKLVCFDLDGTLVDHDFHLPSANLEAVFELRRRGYRITVATGRSRSAAQPYLDALQIAEPMVLSNGTVTYDPNTGERKVLMSVPLDWAKRVIELEQTHPLSVKVHLADGRIFKSKDLPWPDEGVHFVTGELHPNLLAELDQDPIKLVVHGEPGEMDQFQKELQAMIVSAPIRCFRTHRYYLEVTNAHVSKGAALKLLLPRMGLLPAEVVGVGDQENDVELVRDFGLGCRVGDACEQLIPVAKHRLDPPELGGIKGLLDLLPETVDR